MELSRRIYSRKQVERIDKKIKLLGKSTKLETIKFINMRMMTSIIIFFVILYFVNLSYLIALPITIGYYILLERFIIDNKIKKRELILEDDALYFFEVLTLSLEIGRNLEESLDVTINNVNNELSNEFKDALREVKYGKTLVESLTDMTKSIPSTAINNIIVTLTQANIYGSSIIASMYNQLDYLREKRKMEIKGAISKVPIKVSVLSVLFFIPLVLLIILAPILISYLT